MRVERLNLTSTYADSTHDMNPVPLKRGYYLLHTDGGNSGDRFGCAAIGALLRTRRLVAVDQISKTIGSATHNVAEYQALIEGLKLAHDHGIQRIRVYMDSELVVDQVNGLFAVRQAHLSELHSVATNLADQFKSIRISWVPREMNTEADQLVRDALGVPDQPGQQRLAWTNATIADVSEHGAPFPPVNQPEDER